uniref:VQ domain-containing protein n=1 Tax=Oryza meridionalis TaxID=40149 RepID=A0A0E0E3M5_9ORYZ
MAAASFDGAGGALGVHAASRKIGKSATHQQQQRKPVIIYMVSPKIIHVEAHEFMSLVQRLTGPGAAAAGDGDKKAASSSSPREARRGAPPVRVKARALNRPAGGPAVPVSVTATRQQQQQLAPPSSSAAAGPSPSPSTGFLFHDLSPLRGAALKGEAAAAPLVSPGAGWLQHVGDHFFSPVGAPGALGSPSAFLDIFGPLPSQHQ